MCAFHSAQTPSRRMKDITNFPTELLVVILDWLIDDDQSIVYFVSANRRFFDGLHRRVRRITLNTFSSKWTLESDRLKLLGMIENPYHQLIIDDIGNAFVDEGGFNTLTLQKVHSLKMSRIDHFVDGSLRTIVKHTQEKGFLLKQLYVNLAPDTESFGVIPCLEFLSLSHCTSLRLHTLSLPAYESLRSLRLFFCPTVEDVSCLDGIHDLFLCFCENIRDISCLNNNYRIRIEYCDKISTYSRSFRHSRNVEVSVRRAGPLDSLESCNPHASLSLTMFQLPFQESIFLLNSLLFLSLSYVDDIRALPPNRLKKVSIISCSDFESLDNMDNIRFIHLEDLNLTSLAGLGANNQVVKLVKMKMLEDLSSLKELTEVEIRECPIVEKTLHSLTSVKELKISCQNMENHIYLSN